MEYYTPQTPQDDFKPALAGFILAMILAVAVGIFAGYGVRLFLGGDENVALTYQYTERMAAAKTAFSADSYAYQTVAAQLQDTPGVRIYRAADNGVVVCDTDGSLYSAEDYFTSVRPVADQTGQTVAVTIQDDGSEAFSDLSGDEVSVTTQDVIDAVYQLFAGTEASLAGYTDSAGDPVTDVQLWHIAAGDDGNVYFYLYYDYAGFISVAYNRDDDFSQRIDPIKLLNQWYFDYEYTTSG